MGLETGNTKTVAKTSSDDDDDDHSLSGVTDPSTTRQLSEEDAPLSAKETIAVNRSKILVYAALLLAAVAVGTTTYILLSREEEEDFEVQFQSFAREIIDVASSNAGAVFTDVTIMSTAITAYALTSNVTWPFVTVPFFERRLDDGAVELGERHPTIFCPLIMEEDMRAWEDYAAQNQGWIRDGLEFHGDHDVDPGPIPPHVHPLQVIRSRRYNEHEGEQGVQEDNHQEKGAHGDEHEEEGAHGDEHDKEGVHGDEHEEKRAHEGQQHEEDNHERDEDNHEGEGAARDDHHKEEEGNHEADEDHPEEQEEEEEGQGHRGETDTHQGQTRLRRAREDEHEGEGHDEAEGHDEHEGHAEDAAAEEGGGGGGGHDDHHHHHHHGPVEIDFAAAPIWQVDPAPHNVSVINGNVLSNDMLKEIVAIITFEKHQILSEAVDIFGHQDHDASEHDEHHQQDPDDPDPHSYLIQPVFDSFGTFDEKTVVGVLLGEIPWGSFFDRILPEGLNGFVVVVSDKCQTFQTFVVNGPKGKRLGAGQLHDPKYEYLRVQSAFAKEASRSDIEDEFKDAHCHYQMDIYPSDEFRARYISNKPVVYTTVVVLVFVCTIVVFVVYDCFVQRRQARLVKTAKRTNAIVSSMFPRDVQRRMMEEAEQQEREENHKRRGAFGFAPRSQLKDFLDDGNDAREGGLAPAAVSKVKPIADLFPEVTIMFADIVGFTAWSSTREPPQVFMLLESIYHSFDHIAKQRRVFKVETVGDCYVAVAGLPDPRKDHCLVMARFARDCVMKLSSLVKQLEVQLGPDTADIGMRFGLNSGQVTAGVLRGQRARFQLFGDTMNVASRMESTGERNKIQVSGATADLLRASGKGHWVTPRNGLVSVKGKGELQTYWVFVHQRDYGTSSDRGSATDTESACSSREPDPLAIGIAAPSKIQRLADWNTTNLLARLKSIVARRDASGTQPDTADKIKVLEEASLQAKTTVLEETTEIVRLPHFDPKAAKQQKDPQSVQLSDEVIAETRNFVMTIAEMYRSNNPFHNFEHASHVTQSTEKLLSRIVAPDLTDKVDAHDNFDSALDDHTYGITSDPWTQFTVVLSALIHDVDHPGVPNSTLIKEKSAMAAAYNDKSIAESNSVDLAWELLMDERYKNLRRQIYCTEREFHHFRSLLVNTVLATDIMDKELSGLRKARWNKAFSEEGVLLEDAKVTKDRKATIVIEHIIQASDVAHTMQHWHIYTKWNRLLFEELYLAYIGGRSEKDPSDGWYEGEIGFLDFYVIPLAKKLQSCGVFGVSSSECLTYAELNREEWQRKGKEAVESMIEDVKSRVTTAGQGGSLDMLRHDWECRGAQLVESKKVDFTKSLKSALVSTTSDGSEFEA